MIIGIIGPKLSGKGTIAKYIEAKYEANVYVMSAVIVDIMERLYLEKNRANMIATATALRGAFGEDIFAKVRRQDVECDQPPFAVIDGIRMPSEIDIFESLPGFSLIYIDAPIKTRYDRALKRGEKVEEKEISFEEFLKEESAVTEQHIASLRARANVVIENTGSIDELFKRVDEIIQEREK